MSEVADHTEELRQCAEIIKRADAILIGAGAGMGVDAGLETYRTLQQFWDFYPQLKRLGKDIPSMSNNQLFRDDPTSAWGFYGYRYHLYQKTEPHRGYHILKRWVDAKQAGYFIYTSNVDGHFEKAGFDPDRILERHGSINKLQCVDAAGGDVIWPASQTIIPQVNEESLDAIGRLPHGPPPSGRHLARPNLVFFTEDNWITTHIDEQEQNLLEYVKLLRHTGACVVIIEIGAGATIQTVRGLSEYIHSELKDNSTLIRINPMEPEIDGAGNNFELRMNGLVALDALDNLLNPS